MIKWIVFAVFAGIFTIGCVAPRVENIKTGGLNFISNLANKDCECESVQKCNDAGVAYELNGDLAKAKRCYKIACDGGEGVACSNLGSIYQNQKIKSESEILAVFLRSCELDSKFGCYNAANLYRLSKKPNYEAAMRLYSKSCQDLEHAQSCTNLGGMYQFLLGENASLKTAKDLYKKGCEMGDERGCKNLSLILGH